MAGRLGCEVEQILDTKSRSGPFGYMMSGRAAMKGALTKLEPQRNDPYEFDLVVIGTPIWVNRPSVPVRTYVLSNKDRLPKVAFFATYGGSGMKKAAAILSKACSKTPVATLGLTT